jgi:hypothetical protein
MVLSNRENPNLPLNYGREEGEQKIILDSKEIQPAFQEDPARLWAAICEDLMGRFHLSPAGQALLSGSSLNIKAENGRCLEVVLRSIWEERQLDALTRNLIKLAIRQRLGPGFDVTYTSK